MKGGVTEFDLMNTMFKIVEDMGNNPQAMEAYDYFCEYEIGPAMKMARAKGEKVTIKRFVTRLMRRAKFMRENNREELEKELKRVVWERVRYTNVNLRKMYVWSAIQAPKCAMQIYFLNRTFSECVQESVDYVMDPRITPEDYKMVKEMTDMDPSALHEARKRFFKHVKNQDEGMFAWCYAQYVKKHMAMDMVTALLSKHTAKMIVDGCLGTMAMFKRRKHSQQVAEFRETLRQLSSSDHNRKPMPQKNWQVKDLFYLVWVPFEYQPSGQVANHVDVVAMCLAEANKYLRLEASKMKILNMLMKHADTGETDMSFATIKKHFDRVGQISNDADYRVAWETVQKVFNEKSFSSFTEPQCEKQMQGNVSVEVCAKRFPDHASLMAFLVEMVVREYHFVQMAKFNNVVAKFVQDQQTKRCTDYLNSFGIDEEDKIRTYVKRSGGFLTDLQKHRFLQVARCIKQVGIKKGAYQKATKEPEP